MHFDSSTIRDIVMVLVPMILSLSVHEFAHAWSANLLGDKTAASQGRMTLNPIAHIDVFGTLLVPIFSILAGGIGLFGWAKPVPVSPHRFRRTVSMRTGMIITALAGPASNLVFAFLLGGLIVVLEAHAGMSGKGANTVMALLIMTFRINLVLALFNLLPVYPLDGSRVLPSSWQAKMAQYGMVSMILLLMVINLGAFRMVMHAAMKMLAFVMFGFWGLFF